MAAGFRSALFVLGLVVPTDSPAVTPGRLTPAQIARLRNAPPSEPGPDDKVDNTTVIAPLTSSVQGSPGPDGGMASEDRRGIEVTTQVLAVLDVENRRAQEIAAQEARDIEEIGRAHV